MSDPASEQPTQTCLNTDEIQKVLNENTQLFETLIFYRKIECSPEQCSRHLRLLRRNLVQLGSLAELGDDFESLLPKPHQAEPRKSGMTTRSMSLAASATSTSESVVARCPKDLSQFSTEMLTAIFLLLDVPDRCRVAQVCVNWRNAVYQEALWRDIVVELSDGALSRLSFRSLAVRGVRHLRLHKTKGIRKLIKFLPGLRTLDLGQCGSVSDRTLPVSLLQHIVHLTELDVGNTLKLSDLGLRLIAENCTTLVSLKLCSCQRLTDDSARFIADCLRQLQHLDLSGCHHITNAGVAYLSGCEDSCASTGTCPALQSLNLSNCILLTDRSLFYLGLGQTSLIQLDIGFCRFTNLGLHYLGKLVNLRELVLTHCLNVNNDSFMYLSKFTNLVSLNAQNCLNIGDIGMNFLGQLFNLRRLNLSGCVIGDNGLALLAGGGTNVACLDLRDCTNITDEGLRHLAMMTSLRELSLADCVEITGQGLEHLALSKIKLVTLDVTGCINIKSNHLLPLLRCQTNLCRLVIDRGQSSVQGLILCAQLHRLQSYVVAGRSRMDTILRMREILRDAANNKQVPQIDLDGDESD